MIDEIAALRREVAELKALTSRLVAVGRVVGVDPATHQVKVRLVGHDQVTTSWLQVLVPRAFGDRAYWLPEQGEQVWCLFLPLPGLEHGAVIGSSYNDNDSAPASNADVWRYAFKDGSYLTHNRASGQMHLHGSTQLIFSSPDILMRGPVTQTGGDMTSDGISAQHHIHPESIGVETGEPE